jgi:hypothetical protein
VKGGGSTIEPGKREHDFIRLLTRHRNEKNLLCGLPGGCHGKILGKSGEANSLVRRINPGKIYRRRRSPRDGSLNP